MSFQSGNNNNSSSNNNNNNKELLVNKLQGALAKFRNERDQLHRSKRLALERCRLMQDEEEALEKTVQNLRDKHASLEKACKKIQDELGPLEQQVEQDTREVQFQHAELLKARDKIRKMTDEISETSRTQEATLYKTRQFASHTRSTTKQGQKQFTTNTKTLSIQEQTEGLKREFEDTMDFMDLLYKCMDARIVQTQAEMESIRDQTREMEQQVAHYRHQQEQQQQQQEQNTIPSIGTDARPADLPQTAA